METLEVVAFWPTTGKWAGGIIAVLACLILALRLYFWFLLHGPRRPSKVNAEAIRLANVDARAIFVKYLTFLSVQSNGMALGDSGDVTFDQAYEYWQEDVVDVGEFYGVGIDDRDAELEIRRLATEWSTAWEPVASLIENEGLYVEKLLASPEFHTLQQLSQALLAKIRSAEFQ